MRKLVFVPILFFISFLIILYVVMPNYTASNILQNQIEIKEQELKEKQEYFLKIQEISDNLIQYQDFLDKIERALPQKVSLASLMSFFQSKALGSGLVMENLSPTQGDGQTFSKSAEGAPEEIEDKIEETSFNLTVSGSFPSFENFLKTIEISSRLIEVSSVSFGAGTQSEEETVMNFEFDVLLKVYSYSNSE